MNDFITTIKDTARGPWPVFHKDSETAIARWCQNKVGEHYLVRVLKVLPKRSDRAHKLYRLRNATLAPALDTDVDSLHIYIKHALDMYEETQIADRAFKRLRSQKEFSVEEMSAAFSLQDGLRDFVNNGREPQDYLILQTTEEHEA